MKRRSLRWLLILLLLSGHFFSAPPPPYFLLAPVSSLNIDEMDPWSYHIAVSEGILPPRSSANSNRNTKEDSLSSTVALPPLPQLTEEEYAEAHKHFVDQMVISYPTPTPNRLSTQPSFFTAQELMEELGYTEDDLYELQTTAGSWLLGKLQEEEKNSYGIPELEAWLKIETDFKNNPPEPEKFEDIGIEDPFHPDPAAAFTHQAWLDHLIDEWLAQKVADTSL